LEEHKREFHPISKGSSWNKGLTKETDERVAKGTQTLIDGYKSGRLIAYNKGKPKSEEEKKKVSLSMKKAHEEGRANNFAHSRHSCGKMSYPEQWLLAVIKNRFND
jgi:hypothetical protein